MPEMGLVKTVFEGRAAGRYLRHAPLVLLAFTVLVGCTADEQRPDRSRSAALTPEPKPLEPDGLAHMLEEQQGKIVVANFWATWCPPCVAEMPELVKFHERYSDKDVAFLSLSVDSQNALEDGTVAAFMEKQKLPFPVWVITSRDPGAIAPIMKAEWEGSLPATFVYDRKGELAHAFEGEITLDDLAKVVDTLVARGTV